MKLHQTSEDNYVQFDGPYTMQREYGFAPDGTPIKGRWVLRKEGEWIDYSTYSNALADRYGFEFA